MRFIKPLDIELLQHMAQTHDALVTVEEGAVLGGAGSACIEALQALDLRAPVLSLGLPDAWLEHGDPVQITAAIGLDAAGLLHSIHARFPDIVGDLPGSLQRAANA
jgi:1-deoxy-D-xylulose-5-phosphate synthase